MLDKELLRCIFLLKDLDVRKSICCEKNALMVLGTVMKVKLMIKLSVKYLQQINHRQKTTTYHSSLKKLSNMLTVLSFKR